MSSASQTIPRHPATCACCRTDVRRELRRPLHYAETHIDVELLTAAMDATKERLRVLIELEVRKVARRVSLTNPRPSLAVTPAMLAVLEQLRDLGRHAAVAEAASMGVVLSPDVHARRYGAPRRVEGQIPDGLGRPAGTLASYLASYSDRLRFQAHRTIDTKIAGAERQGRITGEFDARAIMAKAIVQTPGALDAAGRVVSMTLAAGMTDVFEANADAFAGWLYTAVLDGATCDECEAADGTEYATWDEAMVDLPDGGPNPNCYGETRCRCRLVPIPAGGDLTPAEPPPGPEPLPPEPDLVLPLAPDGSFSSAAYDQAAEAGAHGGAQGSIDASGVLGGNSGYTVLEHAQLDHAVVMSTGDAIRAEIDRRVAALEPRVSQPHPAAFKAEVLAGRARIDANVAAEKAARDPRFKGAATRAANIAKRLEREAADFGEVHYVRIADIQAVERAVLEERGVEFANPGDLAHRSPTGPSRDGRYETAPEHVAKGIDEATRAYPSSWVEASNENQYPSLKLMQHERNADGSAAYRSHYNPGRGIVAMAPAQGIDPEILVHELGHRMEASMPELVRAERAFYEWRARGGSFSLADSREVARDLYPEATARGEPQELSIFDGWTTKYMGKAYDGDTAQSAAASLRGGSGFVYHGSYEIVSQAFGEAFSSADGGMLVNRETLRTSLGTPGGIRSDRELMQWLYGLLVHVKPTRTVR